MPLDRDGLTDGLTAVFEGRPDFPDSANAAGRRWAGSYRSYAAAAVAGATAPMAFALDAAESGLAGSLASAFEGAAGAGSGSAVAAALDSAFVSFWLAPPMTFATPPTGPPTVTGFVTVAPPGVLTALLAALFTTGTAANPTAATQASSLASALDGWTRTVLVVNTPVTPPGPPLPPVPLA